jgi:3-methyl-2-oxobutanoate hydroxymethyltransferase
VIYDVLDITSGRKPRFVRNFQQGLDSPLAALKAYVAAVKSRDYPSSEFCFS